MVKELSQAFGYIILKQNSKKDCPTLIVVSLWKKTALRIDLADTKSIPTTESGTRIQRTSDIKQFDTHEFEAFLTIFAEANKRPQSMHAIYSASYRVIPQSQRRYIVDVVLNVLEEHESEDVRFYVATHTETGPENSWTSQSNTFYMVIFYRDDMTIALHQITPCEGDRDTTLIKYILDNARKDGFTKAIMFASRYALTGLKDLGFRAIDGDNAYTLYLNIPKKVWRIPYGNMFPLAF